MSESVIFLFSGQGSHYYQMGRELFERLPAFRESLLKLDATVRSLTKMSVVDCLYDSSRRVVDPFTRTLLSHPAIFMVEFALAQALIDQRLTPHFVVGFSVGVFAAAAVAGCLDPEDALAAVVAQARTFEQLCPPGGMIAVLSSPDHCLDGLREDCEVAAINGPSHFVAAVPAEHLGSIEAVLARKAIPCQRLPVSFAFHSRWIDAAEMEFSGFVRGLKFRPASIPLVCGDSSPLGALAPAHLWSAVRDIVRFDRTVAALEGWGPHTYVDVGPSSSLATMLKHSVSPVSASRIRSILSPFGNDWRNLTSLIRTGRLGSST